MCEKWPFFEIFTRFAVNVCGSRYGCRRYFCAFVGSRALVCKVKSFSKKNCCSDFVPFVATCKMYPFEFIGSLQSFDCCLGGGHTPGQDTVFLPSFRFCYPHRVASSTTQKQYLNHMFWFGSTSGAGVLGGICFRSSHRLWIEVDCTILQTSSRRPGSFVVSDGMRRKTCHPRTQHR